jgi:tartrate-resistant acid phosphatase type 5
MCARFRWLLLICGTLAACGADGPQVIDVKEKPRAVRFLAFGDAGSGSVEQIAIGQAMADVCQFRKCDFALALGDNIYDKGVESPSDPLFDTAFEIPYAPLTRQRVPIYLVLGNHDNSSPAAESDGSRFFGDGANNARGDFEIAYGQRKGLATMWRMPARYYRFTAPPPQFSETPLAEFFALDSSPVTPYRDDPDQEKWNAERYAQEQHAWLNAALEQSSARWRIAFAHHPYLSNGVHGNAGSFDEDLKRRDRSKDSKHTTGKLWKKLLDETVCTHGVELYLAAHDHDLQWLKPTRDCGPTEFIVSGAAEGGIKRRKLGNPGRNPSRWQQDDVGGFFWIELTEDQMRIAAFTVGSNGNLVRDSEQAPVPAFEKTIDHPRFECDAEKDLGDEPPAEMECR